MRPARRRDRDLKRGVLAACLLLHPGPGAIAQTRLPFGPGGLHPGVGPDDHREVAEPDLPPWRSIGRVQTELGGRCTGFLIGPRSVATAAHCLFRRGSRTLVQPSSIHFLLGYAQGRYAAHARAVAIQAAPGYDPLQEGQTAGADWAVLTLPSPIGTADRVLEVQRDPVPPGTPALLGGYGKDRAEVIYADRRCTILAVIRDGGGRPVLRHDCAGTSGTSGAPLLVQSATGGWRAAGIQVAAHRDRAGGLAAVMPAPSPQ